MSKDIRYYYVHKGDAEALLFIIYSKVASEYTVRVDEWPPYRKLPQQ